MESPIDKMPEENLISNKNNKKKIIQPIIAFTLSILPICIIFLEYFPVGIISYLIIIMILSPIAGLILGIVALNQGKEVIGHFGKIISIIAIIFPLIPIIFIMIFSIGVDSGIILLM